MRIYLFLFLFCISQLVPRELSKKHKIFNEIDLKLSIEIALKHSPLLKEKEYQKEISGKKLEQGHSRYYPKIDSLYGYRKNFSQSGNETPIENKNYYAGIELSQNIYDFGRTSDNIKILTQYFEISNLDLKQQKEEIVFNIINSYINILINNQNLKVAEENKNYYLKYKGFIQKQIEVGLKTNYELFNVETELKNAEVEYVQFKNQYKLSKFQLLYFMGLEYLTEEKDSIYNKIEEMNVKEISPNEIETIFNKDKLSEFSVFIEENNIKDIYKIALMNRKDYQKQIKEVQIAKLTKELNQNEYFPSLGASFQHFWNDQNYRLNTIHQKNWELNIFVRIPIFEGFITKNKVEESEYFIKQQLEREKILKNNIYMEIQTLFSQYQELKEKLKYYEESLQFAKENLNLSEKRYINGIGTFLELTNAMTLYYNANKNYNTAIFQFYLKKIELYKAMGIILDLL
ncbi:MAG: hypothetical protein KatS3mg129_0493 [Leptospiraceae bacterium]|nr:MAG: hypothetical protein KatS3mg129_0493 [Leptospiraceae bacterium]